VVTTFDSEAAGAHQHECPRKQSSGNLLVVTAQLIEAACHARDGDSDGTRAHIARAVALLDGHPGLTNGHGEKAPIRIPRGGLAAWQSRRLAAHVEANLAGTFNMPARSWIRRRRVELAQCLMLTTGASLSEIALSCGMSDQSHFTRSFRYIVGETPSSWRQTRHGVIEERGTEPAHPRNHAGAGS
jgi:AraC family transcriptional regulator